MYYTGLGAEHLSAEETANIERVAQTFAEMGYTLRTSDASGAARALRTGAASSETPDGAAARVQLFPQENCPPTLASYKRAALRDDWPEQSRGERALTARNYQLLYGEDDDAPSAFVFVWKRADLSAADELLLQIAREDGFTVYRVGPEGPA
jgi:hypothetical protein